MSSVALIRVLWISGLASQALLVAALVARKSWKWYPGFTAYVIFTSAETAVMYLLRSQAHVYFLTYWICEAIGLLLGFLVVYEIFQTLLASHAALKRLAKLTFLCALAGLLLLAMMVLSKDSSSQANVVVKGTWVVEEATRVIEVGLLLFLFLFSAVFGLHWHQRVFGIALGLGVFAAVQLAGIAVRLSVGGSVLPVFNVVRASAFDISLLIWIGYILAPEHIIVAEIPKREQLEQWNQAVMELIGQ
jgi:hypothetical protein